MHHKSTDPSFIPPSLFSLSKISHPSSSITALFSTLYNGTAQGSCSMTVPTYNQDGLFFTPSFYLPYDKKMLQKRVEQYWCAHEQRLTDSQFEIVNIMVAKPTKKNSYCTVCNDQFRDYLTHIESDKHQGILQKNEYRKMIEQLCITFMADLQENEETILEKIAKNRGKLSKTKQIAKRYSSSRENSCEESLKTVSPVIYPALQA